MKEKEEAEEKNGKNVKQQSEAKIWSENLKQKSEAKIPEDIVFIRSLIAFSYAVLYDIVMYFIPKYYVVHRFENPSNNALWLQ